MIHYTCDLCGKELLVEDDSRYEVRIEVKFACEPSSEASEDPEENFEAQVSEILESIEGIDKKDLERGVYKAFRFDLCPSCKDSYLHDPLARRPTLRVSLSEN